MTKPISKEATVKPAFYPNIREVTLKFSGVEDKENSDSEEIDSVDNISVGNEIVVV